MGLFATAAVSGAGSLGVANASAAVAWSVHAIAQPSRFLPNGPDRYQVLASNTGGEEAQGLLTVTDRLPKGLRMTEATGEEWSCTQAETSSEQWTVSCSLERVLAAGSYAPVLFIGISSPGEATGPLRNVISASGGGATFAATESESTDVAATPPEFGLTDFSMHATNEDGSPATAAGGHPWQITTNFGISTVLAPAGATVKFVPAEELKSVNVELPVGFVGNPFAAEPCSQSNLEEQRCPRASQVGSVAVATTFLEEGQYESTSGGFASALYDMKTEPGYPAEFGFEFDQQIFYLDATVVHSAAGDRVRLTTVGAPPAAGTAAVQVTVWGDPGVVNGTGDKGALLTNPTACTPGGGMARIEINSWEHPERTVSAETPVYPTVAGCELMSFTPQFGLAPASIGEGGLTQADEPSAYTADLVAPQTEGFGEQASPELRDATVSLPQGVSVSPASAQGLVGCAATGPAGINLGSSEIGPGGSDLGDPEATEFGEGNAGPTGNGSPYNDDVYHTAPGRCPNASILGSAEVFTPLLPSRCGAEGQPECRPGESPAPLQGHVYLASPRCGGASQPECTEASATNGELFGLYIEVSGSGVIVKLPGTVAADPVTGRLTTTFKDNPQLPFSELKLHLKAGATAPLANPQACGSFATTSTLTSWAGQEIVVTSPAFEVSWDGKGGACPASLPFAPTFNAETTIPTAGKFSPFSLTFSREDREQDLSGLSVTLPPGLLGKIAGVPLCPDAQANAGTCSAPSEIGTASAIAGPGPSPLYVPGGRVYLTTGYKGQPYGLSVVIPAVAGPFNFGNVVVRSAVHIDPSTAQVTVVADPLPQIRDGVPFRVRTINVEVDRAGGFTFNPTDCVQQHVTGTLTGAQGASAAVSSPFAATGCATLPFKPSFTASTVGQASKRDGASLDVTVASKGGPQPGGGEANIAKVKVSLPIQLPSRVSTLQLSCMDAQFAANPAGCPKESDVGTATASTPLLAHPLSGPAYLVSHGGAAFPDLEIVLQGEGITLVLDGKTDIKHSITTSTFDTVPDAPISSFELKLPTGPFSVLGAFVPKAKHYSLCGQNLRMPTTISGQNGAVVTQSTKITTTGCPKAKKPRNRLIGSRSNLRQRKLAAACHRDGALVASRVCEAQTHRHFRRRGGQYNIAG